MSVTKEEIDDLDDLDDLLDDFDETALPATSVAPQTKASNPTDEKNKLPNLGPDDFAKQLQNGMEDLMRELDTSPAARADFEQLMAQMNAATLDTAPQATTSYPNNPSKTASTPAAKNFQDSIEANLQRMKASESQIKEEGAAATDEDTFMAEMMRQFQESAGGEGGGDFSQVLEGMMSQLMSKEILYEPLLELHQKYPTWIAEHPKDEKIETYKKQSALVAKIVAKFEDREYRDEDASKKEEVMDLMSQMQDLGSPPAAIMSEDMGMLDPSKLDGDCSIM
ncbi:Putative uncharacterized protein [Taphrina deformans PYCC 5710]|uniref:Uncharacterized protein n=1 Tax=Taphrina deformans (strain PYCC 5710 / ATCC 11124 / CBS 356.35 / IMI 108563 / JCM 9778 / NBRC 8474) TaxID=1097556 RepID=R4X9U1_TAPDE|nr:Putative uncharacterized protein [Taphrina deformans PYCC 5710]|eukprot:CCG82505.1 Putative uncharacterized protein [Taphrina deformans PYCC 5710]